MGTGLGAVVVGAGAGRRFGNVEKAFCAVAGRPLLCWSVDVLEAAPEVEAIVLVVPAGSLGRGEALVREQGWGKVTAVLAGGRERQDSVRAGLAALEGYAWVLVHDAARPLVTAGMVRAAVAAAREHGAATAALPVRDTLKRLAGEGPLVEATVDRRGLWAAQTPQVFSAALLRAAYVAAGDRAGAFTDDAALVEAAGYPVAVFPGAPENVKLTLPEDLPVVEALLLARAGPRAARG